MTENKQFTLHIQFYNQEKTLGEATLKEMGQPLCSIESIEDARYIKDLLNELYDENQELQSRIKCYDDALRRLQYVTERKLKENEQLKKENNNLKKALWEAEENYLHEAYYDNSIRREDKLKDLKEDFKRGYWND